MAHALAPMVRPGWDPLTGVEIRLTGSGRTDVEARGILKRLRAQVDERRQPETRASFHDQGQTAEVRDLACELGESGGRYWD